MSEILLNFEKRDEIGKNKVNALRNKGIIPAIFYAQNKKPISICIKETDLKNLLSQDYSIIALKLDSGKTLKSVIREIQHHPVNSSILHVDFMGVKLTEKIKSVVPVVLIGIPVGVKEGGGILEQMMREIEIEALPLDIPPHIELDVSHLNLGNSLHVEDIEIDKAKILTKGESSIATIVVPRKEVEVVEEEEEIVEEEAEEEKSDGKDTAKEEEK